MTGLAVWVIGILGGVTTLLSLFIWEQKARLQKAKLAQLKAETDDKLKSDAQVLVNAKLLTATAEADYEKAKLDLPANVLLPAKGGNSQPK